MLSPTSTNLNSDININFTSQSAKLLPYLEKQTSKVKTRGSLQHNHHSEHHLSVKNMNKSPNLTTKQQSRLVTLIKPKSGQGNLNFIKS